MQHDYPACAVFRGGKCTCDEADKLCPKCGSDAWDQFKDKHGRHPVFRQCWCGHEWEPSEAVAEWYEENVR